MKVIKISFKIAEQWWLSSLEHHNETFYTMLKVEGSIPGFAVYFVNKLQIKWESLG